MHNPFIELLRGRTVILGVGNVLRGDDGLGPEVVKRLGRIDGCLCIDAGQVPENYFGKIVGENPDTVLIIDAVQLFEEPGAYRLLDEEQILQTGFSTHTISPGVFMKQLAGEIGGRIVLLGVQPRSIDLGEGLSEQVERSVRELVSLIAEACS
jgi:hydrogenase 3 maturation protease